MMDIEGLREIAMRDEAKAVTVRTADLLALLDSLERAESDATKLAQRLDEANALIAELSERLGRILPA